MPAPGKQQGRSVAVTFEGAEALPILYANSFAIQVAGDGTFIVTIAQAAPPIFVGGAEEQERQLLQVESIQAKVLARVVTTTAKLKELEDLLHRTLQGYLAMTEENTDGTPTVSVTQ